jgi:hypothetical protein
MPVRILTLFLFITSFLSAQQKVSTVCAKEKLLSDSAMRVMYGDYLFENYFVFDTAGSFVWGNKNYLCKWNDLFQGDTVSEYNLYYRFHFSGALESHTYVYGVDLDYRGRLVPDSAIYLYPGRCDTLIGQKQLDELTRKKIHHPLNKCSVTLYPYYFLDNRKGFDSTHVYLEVKYERYIGSGRRGTNFHVTQWSVIVDGCTGEFIGTKKFSFSGCVGGKF